MSISSIRRRFYIVAKIAQYQLRSANGHGRSTFCRTMERRLISFPQSVLSLLHPEISCANILNGLTVGSILKKGEGDLSCRLLRVERLPVSSVCRASVAWFVDVSV